ncbi:claw keratin-like [Crotalus adamanteus]|uniref:Claw keratin-like n=1 Tax=Crotalus adamanteus TaxID=8729 RepID=A0AAW1ANP3_CROAD
MAFCPPSCVIPSCASVPQFGMGSAGASGGSFGGASPGGLAGLGLCGRGLGGGLQEGSMGGLAGGHLGGGVSSGELVTLAGINPQPINQISPAEVMIQPPPYVLTIPGAILSASFDPVTIGGNTPSAAPGSGILRRALAIGSRLLVGRNPQGGVGGLEGLL